MSGMEGSLVALDSFSCLITSSGCSNVLKDLRTCFLGLSNGLDIFRVCCPSGEALRDPRLNG